MSTDDAPGLALAAILDLLDRDPVVGLRATAELMRFDPDTRWAQIADAMGDILEHPGDGTSAGENYLDELHLDAVLVARAYLRGGPADV